MLKQLFCHIFIIGSISIGGVDRWPPPAYAYEFNILSNLNSMKSKQRNFYTTVDAQVNLRENLLKAE